MLNNAENTGQTSAIPEARTEAQTEVHNSLGSIDFDASFGPWMVVSRKRNDNKGAKRNSMSSLLGIRKDHHHKKPIKLFENPSLKRIGLGQAKLRIGWEEESPVRFEYKPNLESIPS